jgi:superfamily II RNA helicase
MSTMKAVGLAAAFAVLSATQVQADEAAETEKVCQDLAATKVAFEDVDQLSRDSTVEDAKMRIKRADKALTELEKSAKKARPEQFKQLESAHKQLKKSVDEAPKDATLGQVQANIDNSKQRVVDAYNDLAKSISCPS